MTTSEYVRPDPEKDPILGPPFSHARSGNCLAKINDTIAIITGGEIRRDDLEDYNPLVQGDISLPSPDSFFFHIEGPIEVSFVFKE